MLWVCRSGPAIDMVPTFKTGNALICLLLKGGQLGVLRTEDAERLQVVQAPLCCSDHHIVTVHPLSLCLTPDDMTS